MRNPWRDSFDRQTGALYIGDVGQGSREEIDVMQTVTAGTNYGWPQREGTQSYPNENQNQCSDSLRTRTEPVLDYGHVNGNCSITGGYVYRGAQFPWLTGSYFYGDYCSGQIWRTQTGGAVLTAIPVLDTAFNISSFGEDVSGELYVVDLGGSVYRIISNELAHSQFLARVMRQAD